MTILQELHEAHKAARARLWAAGRAKQARDQATIEAAHRAQREARRREMIDRVDAAREKREADRRAVAEIIERDQHLAQLLSEPPRVTLMQIAMECAHKHGVSFADMRSARRHRPIVRARQEFFYRARNETVHSYPAIGKFMGDRDHTTVIHGVRKWGELLEGGDV